MKVLIKLFATGLGLGYLPFMPGTYGSVLGLALVYVLPEMTSFLYFLVILNFSLFSVLMSELAERIFQEKDCPKIVIDEVAGMLFVFIGIPLNWMTMIAGFILFRLFDITKPPPIRQSQNLRGGWGVVVDDIIAGIFANIVLQIGLTVWYVLAK